MNILFFAPRFFGYETEIYNMLVSQGNSVDFLPDRPFDNSLSKAFFRYSPSTFLPVADKYYEKAIHSLAKTNYDLILVIQGEALSTNTLKILKNAYPRARMVYYTWDNFSNKPGLIKNVTLYDRSFSFDKEDAKKYDMGYRPLFFLDQFAEHEIKTTSSSVVDIDLSFIGTIHSDRIKVINSIKLCLLTTDINFYTYLYLQAKWVFYFRLLFDANFKGAKKNDFWYEPLSKKIVSEVFRRSHAILDIEHPKQSGMTIRTFETIGSRKKLVTTNPSVVDTDFYCSENIHLIDRRNPSIPIDFLRSPYKPIPSDVMHNYSLSSWLNELIGV